MSPDELARVLSVFKVLADESRLKILAFVAQEERSVDELAALLHLKAPTVSHHLNRLKAAELVEMRADGNLHFYSFSAQGLQRLGKEVLSAQGVAALVPAGDRFEASVFNNFFEGERILQLPTSLKKRKVIVEWLVEKFEVDRRYPEAELNEIIKRHHWDTATLRREMIGWKLMAREAGVYWRTDDQPS